MDDESAQTQVLDPSAYDDPALRIPKVDGKKVDKISVRFSGTVELDRLNPEHVAFFRDTLKLGKEIDLADLSGVVQQKPPRQVATKDGYAGDVKQTAVVKIHTIGGFGAASEE